jgi:hypothetical protein
MRKNSFQDKLIPTVCECTELRRLTGQYWTVCELMRRVDHLLSWHLLVSVVSLSLHTIIALFNLFSAIWPMIGDEVVPQLVIGSLWVTINTLELLMILRSSTSVTDMVKYTLDSGYIN